MLWSAHNYPLTRCLQQYSVIRASMYQKILVTLNGSAAAEEAIPYALELQRLSGGTLTLVRVVPSPIDPPALYSMADAETWLVRQRQLRSEAELYLSELIAQPEFAAAHAECIVIAGDVSQALLTLMEQEPFDVLVMATRDRRDPMRWVLGSVADYLVQRTTIPVLLVRQRKVVQTKS